MRSLLILSLLLFVACANPIVLTDPVSIERVRWPSHGDAQTVTAGEVAVSIGKTASIPVLHVEQPTTFGKYAGEASIMTCGFTLAPGTAKQRGEFGRPSHAGPCFGPYAASATEADGTATFNCQGVTVLADVCYAEEKNFFFLWLPASSGRSIVPLEQEHDNLSISMESLPSTGTSLTELLYDGLDDNKTLRFTYRKTDSDGRVGSTFLAAALSQDGPSILRHEDIHMEILGASAEWITYRIIHSSSGGQ